VLVRTLASGLCHSDIHFHEGQIALPLPITLGHEAAGEVVAIGSDVKTVNVGDKVVIFAWHQLDLDRKYKASLGCGGVDGAFATHVIVPEDRYCLKINNIPIEQAALLACSGVTGYKALKRVKEALAPERRSRVLVIIGAGGVGLQAIRLSKLVTGVAPIVCDIDDKKLQLAKQIGPEGTITVNTSNPETAFTTLKSLVPTGPDAVIDFVGLDSTFQIGIKLLALKQHTDFVGKYIAVGIYGGSAHVPLVLLISRLITVEGTFAGNLEDLKELIALVDKNRNVLKEIPVERRLLGVESVNEGLEALKKGKVEGRLVMCAKL